MPNGIDLVLADHRSVDALFEEFDDTHDATLVGQIIHQLSLHDDAEQAALYPFALEKLSASKVIDRAEVAHSAVKRQIEHVTSLEGGPLVDAVAALRKLVDTHVKDEEKNLLPQLADAATAAELDSLGARILQAKQRGG
ncbi:MAG: hemerythrin domain-containing protein [Acidimicrobiales bacterium]